MITALALGAIFLWREEVSWRTNRDEFNWLGASQKVSFGINLLVVLAYLVPISILKEIALKKLLIPSLELYLITFITFFLTKSILISLFSYAPVFSLSPAMLWLMLGVLAITTASSYYYLTKNRLYQLKVAYVPLMIVVELSAVLLAIMTTYIILGGDSWQAIVIDAVKGGYAFFYVTLLIGLFSIFCIKNLQVLGNKESHKEILDDVEFPS